ncbi:MAG: riboflavin biosynthesis protein RibF [Candidatus Omnitrophica bacterium]|nr:riboflavin biosynthesis protein RibF [Candidatus Omnitrophota bacterium]
MQVLTQFHAYKPKKYKSLVLTLGTFDGVHEGHQHVLAKVLKHARAIGGTAAILTFAEHPLHVLRHKEPPYLITSTQHRLRLLDQLGFDLCFLIRFNKKFSLQTSEQFVKNILMNQLHVGEVVLGYDSRFGKNREGCAQDMARLAKKNGFKFSTENPRLYYSKPISSTQIRSLIVRGDLGKVKKCLGRTYSILGDVEKGSGVGGKLLGFPTANLNPHSEALPPKGVYLVRLDVVEVGLGKTRFANQYVLRDKILKTGLFGLLNIGHRPTVQKELGLSSKGIVPEIHILNFKGNLYGKTLEVTFIKKIRDEIRFESLDKLKKQIKKDVHFADKLISISTG